MVKGRHYVPAWGVVIDAPDGSRLAYTGDTGPSASVEEGVRDADLLLVESALGLAAHDDPERGHLTPEEAIELARHAGARSAILVHYGPAREARDGQAVRGRGPVGPDARSTASTVTVRPAAERGRTPEPSAAPA